MRALLLPLLLLAGPAFETFDQPLDVARWHVGAPNEPRNGRLELKKGSWIAARDPGEKYERLEIRFRHRGGPLRLTFHDRRAPLCRPTQPALEIAPAKGDRVLVVSPAGAKVDGIAVEWKGEPGGAFRIAGAVELDEIRVAPAPPAPPEPSRLELDTVFWRTTPERHDDYRRVTLTLWDVPVALLLARGEPAVAPLQGEGGPVLAYLVRVSDGRAVAARAATHPDAMRDWSDERGNLDDGAFAEYLAGEYARFELLAAAQRVLNASLPARKLDALVPLAVIRHANSARAAVALAETQKQKAALKLLRAELPKGRVSSDQIRAAAGRAARTLLGEAPPEWRGFAFDPADRYVTLQEAKEHLR